jgi:hypothetical protein
LPVVLYGCESWSLTLREEHRSNLLENTVLRRILGPKRVDMVRGYRHLHKEEFSNLRYLPVIIRMLKSRSMRWSKHVARMEAKRNAHRVLVGKPEGERPLRRLDVGGRIILKCILEK